MIGKHFLCKDKGCKICSERRADKIIKEELAKAYTRADMIRAFVQGAEYGYYEVGCGYSIEPGVNERQSAEIQAHWLLKIGKLGKEEE